MSGRHLVVALDRPLAREVTDYVREWLEVGVPVCLLVADEPTVAAVRAAGSLPAHPQLEVRALQPDEDARSLARRLPARLRRLYTAVVRPWVLGRRWRSVAAEVNLTSVERLVAADVAATTLVWRLCRRFPHVVATTALDPPATPRRAS